MTNNIEQIGGGRRYSKPQTEILPLTAEAFEYLTKVRGLRKDTLEAYRLGCNNRGEIVIPFYDEKDELMLVKFRHSQGKMLQWRKKLPDDTFEETEGKSRIEKGGKGVLLGSHLCEPSEGALVICFGDYDAMAVAQDGVPNCVGLPFGDGGFEFIDHQWNFIESFKEIIIYNDADKFDKPEAAIRAQKKLDELATRLGTHRCRIVRKDDRYGTKDANELLLVKGDKANRTAIENAEWFPTGIVAVADYEDSPIREGTPIGLPDIDKVTGGFAGGNLILVAGDNESGKTTEVLNITAKFVDEGEPVFWWSGEQNPGELRYWFERIVAGRFNLERIIGGKTGFEYFFPLEQFKAKIRNWYRNFLFQYTKVGIDAEEFFKAAEIGIRRYGCRLIVIDNLMAFTGGEGDGYYQAQGDFAQSCKRFAQQWDVPVVLICHIKKIEQRETQKKPKLPDKDSIEGSKKVTNWADFVLIMFKLKEEHNEYFPNAEALIMLRKTRSSGIHEAVRLRFDRESNRLCQVSEEAEINRKFGWEQYESEH
ncbi:MAG: bifunctional DNA primase/helicase [Pyrinomonadaceae bacterium]